MGMIRKNINCPKCGEAAIEMTNINAKSKEVKCFSCKLHKKYVAIITWKEKDEISTTSKKTL